MQMWLTLKSYCGFCFIISNGMHVFSLVYILKEMKKANLCILISIKETNLSEPAVKELCNSARSGFHKCSYTKVAYMYQ